MPRSCEGKFKAEGIGEGKSLGACLDHNNFFVDTAGLNQIREYGPGLNMSTKGFEIASKAMQKIRGILAVTDRLHHCLRKRLVLLPVSVHQPLHAALFERLQLFSNNFK